jgi:hypothetical protein
MMRRVWGLAAASVVVCTAGTTHLVHAQAADVSAVAPEPEPAPAPDVDVYGASAMPGGLRVPSAEAPSVGTVSLEGLSGVGTRSGLLAPNHRFDRVIGDFAAAYTPVKGLSIGVELDGRYDVHYGIAPSGESGEVGDPHLYVRWVSPPTTAAGGLRFGAQGGIWLPGENAPSIAASAISLEGMIFATLPVGPGKLSAMLGVQLDRSKQSISDPDALTVQDQVSLGISAYDEGLAGLRYAVAGRRAFVGAEFSAEAFIGGDAPGAILRGTLSGGVRLTPGVALLAYVEASHVPSIPMADLTADAIPLIPYEPAVSGGLAINGTFGGRHAAGGPVAVEKDCARHNPPDCAPVKLPITADITGVVLDDAGKPVVGAKVTLTLKASQVPPAVTDDKGGYAFTGVPIGTTIDGKPQIDETAAEIGVAVDGKKPGTATVPLVAGKNAVPNIALESLLPPGELRAIVTSLQTGQPIRDAKVTIEPGGKTIQTGADGTFKIALAPGQYKITVTAAGLATQQLDVTIDTDGVTTKNINMRR